MSDLKIFNYDIIEIKCECPNNPEFANRISGEYTVAGEGSYPVIDRSKTITGGIYKGKNFSLCFSGGAGNLEFNDANFTEHITFFNKETSKGTTTENILNATFVTSDVDDTCTLKVVRLRRFNQFIYRII